MAERACEICGIHFQARRSTDLTCSQDCSIQLRRLRSRESIARRYVPRPRRPDGKCEGCGAVLAAPKSGPMPKWCRECRATKEDVRTRARIAVRRCHKCKEPVPDAERKPGVAVCDKCRVDPRKHRDDHERRRRLRKYGLTQAEYDQLLKDQDGHCPGCGTHDPGAKGWCIDHCHRSGRVRGLLCHRCNTMLGLAKEDPMILRSLADFAERMSEIKI